VILVERRARLRCLAAGAYDCAALPWIPGKGTAHLGLDSRASRGIARSTGDGAAALRFTRPTQESTGRVSAELGPQYATDRSAAHSRDEGLRGEQPNPRRAWPYALMSSSDLPFVVRLHHSRIVGELYFANSC